MIDGLHTAARSRRVIDLHGNLMQSRYSVCDRPPFEDGQVGGTSWLVNLDPAANEERFDHVVHGAAGAVLPPLLAAR